MTRRRLPSVLRVLSLRVPISTTTDLEHETVEGHSHPAWGLFDPDHFSIQLREGDGHERRKVTLMHEMLHAMLSAGSISGESEEALVTSLAPVMLNVLRENTALVAYLQEVS